MDKYILTIGKTIPNQLIEGCKELKYKVVFVTDSSEDCSADIQIKIDIFNSDAIINEIDRLNLRNHILCVVPTWEGTVEQCAIVASTLNISTNSIHSIKTSRDKFLMYKKLHNKNIQCANTVLLDCYDSLEEKKRIIKSKIGYPAIIKLRSSTNSQGVIKICNDSEFDSEINKLYTIFTEDNRLSKLSNRYEGIIAQEYIEGVEVNLDIFYKDNKYLCVGFFEKEAMDGPYFPETMSFYPSFLSDIKKNKIIDIAVEGIKSIGATIGIAHIELRNSIVGPKIIEIALRPGGAYTSNAIEILSKCNIYYELIRLYTEKDYFPRLSEATGACLYAGLLAKKAGVIKDIRGIDEISVLPELKDYKLVKNIGDIVKQPPTTSDPHILHYLISSNNLEQALLVRKKIEDIISIEYKEDD